MPIIYYKTRFVFLDRVCISRLKVFCKYVAVLDWTCGCVGL